MQCEGECPCPEEECNCSLLSVIRFIYDPVCGSNYQTYGHRCLAECQNIEVTCKGECPCGGDTCICNPEHKWIPTDENEFSGPVCGMDGVTYTHQCAAKCKHIGESCKGECPCETVACECSQEWNPVCGVDGMTYGNPCEAKCKGIPQQCTGECPCKTPCICPAVHDPIC